LTPPPHCITVCVAADVRCVTIRGMIMVGFGWKLMIVCAVVWGIALMVTQREQDSEGNCDTTSRVLCYAGIGAIIGFVLIVIGGFV
jgi:hypothetical protein